MDNFYLTKLIKSYFDLPKGYIIDNPNLLSFVCKIFDVCDVYISNKALKHIVESRRDKDKRDLENIFGIITNIKYVLSDNDIIFVNDKSLNSIGVCKKIKLDKPYNSVIILEFIYKHNHYEIITAYEVHDKKVNKFINIKHLIK